MLENRLAKSKSQLELALAEIKSQVQNKNYLAAQSAQQKAEKLKYQISTLEKKGLKSQQKKDLEEMKGFQEEECRQFEDRWKETLNNLNEETGRMLDEQQSTHLEEKALAEQQFNEELKTFHQSNMILTLKQKQLALAKQKSYLEAHSIQAERRKLEEIQKQNWQSLLQQKLKIRLNQLSMKQEQQKNALLKKISSRMREATNNKEKESEELKKKQRNLLRECKSVHEKENLTTTGRFRNIDHETMKSIGTMSKIRSPAKTMLIHKRIQTESLQTF